MYRVWKNVRKELIIMRKLEKYKGVIPAFYACYDENGEISPKAVQELTQYFIEKGVKGVYVNGSSGECIYQSVEDRKITLENVMKVAKGKMTVIAHVACNNTKDSVELARHAESLGVDAIAAIPPIYFKLPDYAIAEYWNDMSAAAPNTDFIIYNIPQLAGVALSRSLFAEMRKNPRVIGVKNSSMPVQDIQMFKMDAGEDYVIFNGPDEQFVSGRVIGAEGGIGGTYGVMPELFLKMDEYIKTRDMDKAMEIQYAVDAIIYKMCSAHGNMYAVIKEILKINEGICIGSVRKPLAALKDEDMTIVQEAAKMIREAKEKFLK
jgi:N-acetylneuraminate lyase